MKKITATLVCCVFAAVAYCQNTTQTEYNYIKKGLPESEEKGLDIKQGYTLKELFNEGYTGTNYKFTIRILNRTDKTVAGYSIYIYKAGGTFTDPTSKFLCMPAPNTASSESVGWNDFYTDLGSLPSDVKDILLKIWSYKASIAMMK